MQRISVNKTNHSIHWIVIYPVDSVIQPLNNRGLVYNIVLQKKRKREQKQDMLAGNFQWKLDRACPQSRKVTIKITIGITGLPTF